MSINNHNAGTDLNDINLGALAISDDGNSNNNNEGGDDINAAELLGLPEDHPMPQILQREWPHRKGRSLRWR